MTNVKAIGGYIFLLKTSWLSAIIHGMTDILVWNVNPNVRCDRLLTKQANLINKFAPKDVWNNVIIIAKQSMSPEDDCRYGI